MKINMIFLVGLISISTILSCSNLNDELNPDLLESASYDYYIDYLKKNNHVKLIDDDSVNYEYKLVYNDREYSTIVSANAAAYGAYRFGKLRDITVNLNGDTLILFGRKQYKKGSGLRLKSEVDDIYEFYVSLYGMPDSISERFRHKSSIDSPFGPTISTGVNPEIPEKTSFWSLKGYRIVFQRGSVTQRKEMYDSSQTYDRTYIRYESNEYDDLINKIQDSIRRRLSPSDMVKLDISDFKWIGFKNNRDELSITFNPNINRNDLEEPRGINSVRFDLVITDLFEEELIRIEDVDVELDKPLLNGWETGFTSRPIQNIGISIPVNSKLNLELRNLWNFMERGNKIRYKAIVNAVMFSDNTVLKQ